MTKYRLPILMTVLVLSSAPAGVRAEEPETTPGAATESPPGAATDSPADSEESAEEPEEVKSDLDSLVRVVQQRPIVKAMRFEVAFLAGVSTADVMHNQYALSGGGRFHISEWLSVGASYSKYLSSRSQIFSDVTGDLEVYPELSEVQWYAGADVALVMFDGKFKLFDDAIGYWDIYALLGGGVTKTSRGDSPLPTGMLGVGMRIFLAKWLTLSFELRDHIYVESFAAGNELVNNVVGQGGISIFIPFGFDYSYSK